MIAKTVGFAFTLAMPIVIVRVLNQAQFGTYKQAFLVVSTAQSILPFSFGISAFYFLPRAPELRRQIVCNIVAYYAAISLLALGTLLLWPGILNLIVGDNTITKYAPLIAVVLATWVFSSLLEIIATANTDVLFSTAFIITAQVMKALLLIAGAVSFRTVESVLHAAVLQGCIQSCLLLWYLHYRFPSYWRTLDWQVAREQISYVVPIGVAGTLFILSLDLHNYFVAYNFTTVEYAIYAVGTAQIPLVGILRDSINVVVMSRVSKLQSENQPGEILALMIRAWRKLSIVLLPASAALLVLGKDFIEVLYTARYSSSWPVFAVNLTLLPMGIFISDSVLRAYAEYRFWNLNLRIFLVILQVAASFLFLRSFGLIGALLGLVIATAADRVISLYMSARILGFRKENFAQILPIVRLTAASAISGALTFSAVTALGHQPAMLRLAAGLVVFGLIYAVLLIVMRLLESDEIDLVNRYSLKLLHVRLLT